MRIALFCPNLRGGGKEKVAILLANGLAAQGIATDLLLLSAEGAYGNAWISPLVNLISFSQTREKSGIKRRIDYLLKFHAYLREKKPDACIAFENATDWLSVLGRMVFLRSMKLIVTIHNTNSVFSKVRSESRVARLITALLYRCADLIVAVSQASARDAEKYYCLPEGRVRAIYNPVISPEILQLAQAEAEHPWLAEASSVPVILAVGRFSAQKNYPLLIEAFSIVRKKTPCRLLILGEGEDRLLLERQIKTIGLQHDIALPGFGQNPYAFMRKASVLALSSLVEGLPCVLIEALACGCPIVSTDCPGGAKEILGNGRYGALVPVNDAAALASALGDALAGKLPCTKEERIARGKEFSVDNATRAYLDALQQRIT